MHILELFDTPVGYVAFDATTIRHLGVVRHQTRRGYGSALFEFASLEIFSGGAREAELWVLVDNEPARAFYRSHHWNETDERRKSEYPPYPESDADEAPQPECSPAEPVTTAQTARRSWDSTRPARRGQFMLIVLAGRGTRFPPSPRPSCGWCRRPMIRPHWWRRSSRTGWSAIVTALCCLGVVLLRARRRAVLAVLCTVLVALTVLHASWLAPFFVPDERPVRTRSFTVMSLNLQAGGAASRQVWQQAQQADIVILVEVTPAALSRLAPLGWDQRFPYAVGDPREGVTGTAIYSRFPLGAGRLIDTTFQQWLTTVTVPGIGTVTLMGVHPCNPYCGGSRWASEHAVLAKVAAEHRERSVDHGR